MAKHIFVYKGNAKFRSKNTEDALSDWAKKGFFPKVINKEEKKKIEKELKKEGKVLKEVKEQPKKEE